MQIATMLRQGVRPRALVLICADRLLRVSAVEYFVNALRRIYLQQRIRFFKAARHLLTVALLLLQRFRVPLTARNAKEIAAVDVQRAG